MEEKKAQDYINEGLQLYEEQNYTEALAAYTKAIELEPDNAKTYKERGIVFWRLELYEEAILDLGKAVELGEDDNLIYRARGAINYFMDQYEEAISDFSKAIELGDEDACLYKFRADVKFALKQYESSVEDYNKAISLEKDYIDAYLGRGVGKYFLKQYDEAMADYDYALSLDGECSNIYYARADMYIEMKQYEKALRDYELALRYGVDEQCLSTVYMCMGIAQYNMRMHNEALESYKKALEKAAFNFDLALEIMSNMAFVYMELAQDEDVISTCSKCLIAKENDYAWLYFTRAVAYTNLGNIPDAMMDLAKLVKKWNATAAVRIDEAELFSILYSLKEEHPKYSEKFAEIIKQFQDLLSK